MYDATNNRLQTLSKTNGSTKQYRYDANGNMLQAGDNAVTWTAFNQPLDIRNSKTNSLATFRYDANQQRVQQVNGTTGKSETTTYVSKALEVTHNDVGVNDRVTQYKHHIYAGDEVVAIQIRTLKNGKKAPDETRYLHQDALGNVDTITDSNARIIQRISYDPFGKRTVTSGSDPDRKAWTARGFTGHEHLDNLGLIHMNARLYDPEIGRFVSADSVIPAPNNSQSYNRYVYVMNNPLKYTDPSGHFPWFIVGAIVSIASAQSDNKYIRAIGMAAGMAMMGGAYGGSLFSTTGVGGMIGNGMAAGFVQGYATTGTLTGAFNGMVQGGISAGFAFGIGHGAGGNPLFGTGGTYLAHGVSQGIISKLRGGGFKSGFVGAIIGHASGGVTGGIGGGSSLAITLRTVIAAVFGGVAAQATGGSFADGALSAAVTHLFNDEADNLRFLAQGYNRNNVMGGFDEYGDSLVYHPDYYDPSGAALFLLEEVGAVAGGVYALSAVAVSGNVTVSTWVGLGQTADFVAGRWVIVGGVTRLNYAKTALWGPQVRNGRLVIQGWKHYPFSQGTSSSVPISRVGWPNGIEKWRGIFGQRQLR